MITNEKIRILEVWRKDLFRELTLAEIMKETKKETKTWIFNAMKLLANNKIVSSTRKANVDLYRLNVENPLSLQFLQYLEAQNNVGFPKLKVISEIIEKSPIKSFCVIVFGSYADNKQTKSSDLDIALLIENKEIEKKIKPYMNEVKLNHSVKIDEQYITFEDFIKMLLREEENLAKQIFIKRRLFHNSEIYYSLLKEAHKNGFRP